MSPKARVIYWFRTDLRLHDSPALKAALDLKPECFWPIWCWDPHYVYRTRVGPNRWQFLLDCQNDLSKSITKLNSKSKLFVIREALQTLLPKLFKEWKVTHLVFEKDPDGYGQERDEEILKLAKEANVKTITKSGRTLYDIDELIKANSDKPTMSMSQVQHAGKKLEIPKPIPTPKSIPDPGPLSLDFEQETPSSDPDYNAKQRHEADSSYSKLSGPNGNFSVPTMEELGLKKPTGPHRGGESIALKMVDNIISNKHYTATFEKPKTAPTAFEPQSTTLLSPHFHFGSLSCRLFYWHVQDIVEEYGSKASQPPASLTGQLLFRDMYFGAQAALGWKFNQTVGNRHCRFIPWHLRSIVDEDTGRVTGKYLKDSKEAEEWFIRWKWGKTGFPWIDAIMRQLRQEGWIHHLARHAVACFLTRGGCYIDWERGAEVFEEWLIDHEAACNAGNWQWLSCSAFYSMYYRVYSPIAFPQKTDKNGDFVRKYVPELAKFPAKYIYEPWMAPIPDQKKAGCLIKGDGSKGTVDGFTAYPKPMFDFNERRQICIDAIKNAYHVGLHGDDKKVMDGTWCALFDDDAEGATAGKSDKDARGAERRLGDDDEIVNMDDEGDGEFADHENGEEAGGNTYKKHPGSKRKRAPSSQTLDKYVTKKAQKS